MLFDTIKFVTIKCSRAHSGELWYVPVRILVISRKSRHKKGDRLSSSNLIFFLGVLSCFTFISTRFHSFLLLLVSRFHSSRSPFYCQYCLQWMYSITYSIFKDLLMIFSEVKMNLAALTCPSVLVINIQLFFQYSMMLVVDYPCFELHLQPLVPSRQLHLLMLSINLAAFSLPYLRITAHFLFFILHT